MTSFQVPQNELAWLFDKLLIYARKRKVQSIFLYIIFLLYFSIPSFQIPLLQFSHFRVTSLMEQRAIENNLNYYPEQSWVNIDDVNPVLLKAIISMEDGKFFMHKGIDWKQLNTSLRLNKRKGRIIRGASTLTMQLAKNLYFSTRKTFIRKTKELLVTFRMEKELSKRSILQNYINAVEWGDGIFGVRKAAEIYFHKDPRDLNKYECARLAAVIPSPLKHQPNSNSSYVIRRTAIILNRMGDVILFPKKKL